MRASTLLLSQQTVDTWMPRSQQIFAAEAMAVLAAAWNDRDMICGRDIVWFVHNEAAAASLIRGGSREYDVNETAEATHLLVYAS